MVLCLCRGENQKPSEEYGFVTYFCHEGTASDAYWCTAGDHIKGASLLLVQSKKTESEYVPFPFSFAIDKDVLGTSLWVVFVLL